jgi:hypothetical protein
MRYFFKKILILYFYLKIIVIAFKDLYSSFSKIPFSIDNMTNPFNLSCDIIDLRYDFINFNLGP